MGTAIAHCAECGGQATGGLYAGGWEQMDGLESIGYPITTIREDGSAVITKTPGSGGAVTVGTVSEQLVYEMLDPANYLTADAVADCTLVTLEQVGPDAVAISGVSGKPAPAMLKVNMGYRAGFVGEAQFTYTWPDAYRKAQAGLALLRKRLERSGFRSDETRVEYLGHNSMWSPALLEEPDDPERHEIVVRFAARCPSERDARMVFTESVPLYNNGPAGLSGIGTRPALKELYALWPCLVPRELVPISVDIVEA
jgi:hypothetical protein